MNVMPSNTRICSVIALSGSGNAKDLRIELSQFGISDFIIRPDDGRIFPVFLRLPIELRRRLNSSLSDDKAIIALALQRHWVIVRLRRTTVYVRGMAQEYIAEVLAERQTFGGIIRSYHRTYELLRHMEKFTGNKLRVRVRIFTYPKSGPVEIDTHLSSSADFAKIFMHTYYSYNRPLER